MTTSTNTATYAGFRYVLVLVMMLLAGTLAWYFHIRRTAGQRVRDRLSIAKSDLNFGTAWAQDEFRWTVSLRNPTNQHVSVSDLQTSCGCAAVAPRHFQLPPNSSETVEFVLDLRNGTGQSRNERAENFQVDVTPLIDSRIVNDLTWTLKGTVKRPFVLSPPVADFGDSLVAGSAFKPQRVNVLPSVPISDIQVEHDPEIASVELLPSSHSTAGSDQFT